MAKKIRLGIVDTMFARVNMGAIALNELEKSYPDVEAVRTTVPGIKDLPAECKKLLDSGCDTCMALGMVGGAAIDTMCGHEASLGLMQIRASSGKHVIEVFVHENEAWSEKELFSIFDNRVRKHLHNAVLLVRDPSALVKHAGMGIRQGKDDEGAIDSGKERKPALGIVAAEFNRKFSDEMISYAVAEAAKQGAEIRTVMRVPGAFEIPIAVKKMLWDKKIDGVVTLGYVKRGQTKHDRIISENAAAHIMNLSLESRKPVSLGVITLASESEAQERKEDYARRSVQAAVKMIDELRK